MKTYILVVMAVAVLTAVAGCASLDERYSTQYTRHPCGNVWDICPGDSYFLDKAADILTGANAR